MGESSMAIQSKDSKRIRRSEISIESGRTATKTRHRATWRSFFNLFTKNSADRFGFRKTNLSRKESEDIYLNEINDDLALAIYLPEDVRGKDVKVSIELEAIKRDGENSQSVGLKITKESPSKASFSGIIKVPPNVTIREISQMPLYFANATGILRSNGQYSHKIETVIKPLEDNLPTTIDEGMIVADIKLLVNLQNVKKVKRFEKRQKILNYAFIRNEKPKAIKASLHSIKTEEIIEEIAQTKQCYNEESKNIVKEILSHVVQKVQVQDISTQYSQLITTVSKEIDVQKSLLIKGSDAKFSNKTLTKIDEKSSVDSLYPNSSTSESLVSEVNNSLLYLKVPANTPNLKQPRYVIKYDSRLSIPERKLRKRDDISLRVLHPYYEEVRNVSVNIDPFYGFKTLKTRENVKSDIDKTLELLETAKHKLISYLDTSIESDVTVKPKSRKMRDYLTVESSESSFDNIERYASPIHYSNREHQFFLAPKNEEVPDLITFSKEDVTPQLNTIQNIYSSNGDGSDLEQSRAEKDELLKRRYSGDYHEENKLAYAVVENDISMMIQELLNESNAIKELALNEVDDPKAKAVADVNYVIDILLDGVSQKAMDWFQEPPICVSFCLLRDIEVKAPVISVKIDKSNVINDQFNKDTLVDKLEKGGKFLTAIYNEMCYDLVKPTEVLVYENHNNVCVGRPEDFLRNTKIHSPNKLEEVHHDSSIVLPFFKEEYISQQELNNKDEVDYIEENVKLNNDADQSLVEMVFLQSNSATPSTLSSSTTNSSIEINTQETLLKQ